MLDSTASHVDRLLDVYRLKEAKAAFQSKAKTLKSQVTAAQRGTKSSSKILDYNNRLLSLMGLGDSTVRDDVQAELEALELRMENESYVETDDDIRIQYEASILNVEQEGLTTKEYEDYLDALNQAEATGRQEWAENKKRQKLKAKATTATLLTETRDSGRKNLSDPEAAKKRSSWIESLRGKPKDILEYRAIATLLSREKVGRWLKFFDSIADKAAHARSNQHIFRDIIDSLAKKLKVDLDVIGATFLMELNGRDISIHDAMFIYAHSQNQRGLTHLANTKFGSRGKEVSIRKEIDSVVEALPQKYKDVVDAIIDYHDIVMFPRMSDLHKKRFGISMKQESRYMPIRALFTGSVFTSLSADHMDYSKLRMSNQKARSGSKLGFSEFNFLGDVLHNNFMSEQAIALYDSLALADAVLSNREIQKEANAISSEIIPYIKAWLTRLGRGQMKPADTIIEKAANSMKNGVSRFFVSISPSSYLKMLGPLFAMKKDVKASRIAASTFKNPMRVIKKAKSMSNMMKTRAHTTRIVTAELAESKMLRTPQKSLGVPVLAKGRVLASNTANVGYFFFNALDVYTTGIAWDAAFDQAKNKGKSDPDAKWFADHMVNTYFPSGALEQMAPIFANAGLIRQIVVFTADMNKIFNLGYSTTQLKDRKVVEAILFVAFPIFASSLYLALTDIPEDWLKEALGLRKKPKNRMQRYAQDTARYATSNLFGGVPFAGQSMEAFVARTMGDDATARMLSNRSMVFTVPLQALDQGKLAKAILSAKGAPGGKFYAEQIDEYIEEQFD